MINEFNGFNISSKNPTRLKHFYHEILGMPILEDDENNDGVQYGFLENGPRFWVWDENKWGKCNKGPVNLVFGATNLEELYQSLRAHGVQCDPPYKAVWGGDEFTVLDPDGNILTIL